MTNDIIPQNCAHLFTNSQNWPYRGLLRPKNYKAQKFWGPKHCHVPTRTTIKASVTASDSRANTRHLHHNMHFHAPCSDTRLSCMTAWMTSPNLVWPVHRDPDPNHLQEKLIKKEKALTKWTFDFDQKVKIFLRGMSHSVFRVSECVSSFETWKLCKLSNF